MGERVQELSRDCLAAVGQLPKARHIADIGLLVRSNGAVDLDEMLADALEEGRAMQQQLGAGRGERLVPHLGQTGGVAVAKQGGALRDRALVSGQQLGVVLVPLYAKGVAPKESSASRRRDADRLTMSR